MGMLKVTIHVKNSEESLDSEDLKDLVTRPHSYFTKAFTKTLTVLPIPTCDEL